MELIPYRACYKEAFIALNKAWIERYFSLEEADQKALQHSDELLKTGAMIYFAVEEDEVLATCMALPLGEGVWEICKLAADVRQQGKGAGSMVFKACMDYALRHGATKLTLVSNHILEPALHIYEKFGFSKVPLTDCDYTRGDVQYEFVPPQP